MRIAQRVNVGGKARQPFGDFLDDGAELGITLGVVFPQLGRAEVNL